MNHWKRALFCVALLAAVPLLLAGCPSPTPTNQAPIANAGANQSVNPGDAVALSSAGSTDLDGDTITFAWEQTAGTPTVNLTGANTASASFTAPAGAALLTFRLTVSDGTLSATDTVDVGVNTVVARTPVLYVADLAGKVLAFDITQPNSLNGNVPPTANLSGPQTLLTTPTDVVITGAGSLLAINAGGKSVTTYLNAADLAGINGNVAPARNVQGAATTLSTPISLAVQTVGDLLFVSDLTLPRILVFSDVSTTGFNGNKAPLRTFTSVDVTSPFGINLGAADTLYVANSGLTRSVAVFDNASTLNGPVAASRTITSPGFFTNLFDVFVDATNDRMFVLDTTGKIFVFESASTRNGNVMPDVTLTVTGAMGLTAIAVDSRGVGYIVDQGAKAVYSYDNIATRNGALIPDRVLKGTSTQFVAPIRVFLLE